MSTTKELYEFAEKVWNATNKEIQTRKQYGFSKKPEVYIMKEMIEDYIQCKFGENWRINPPIIKS